MSDSIQTIQEFWASFDLPAYDENTVPEGTAYPYITYNVSVSNFDEPVTMSASLWYKSYSWKEITLKAETIRNTLKRGGKCFVAKDGALWIKPGVPFAQRMSDEDDTIRRIYLNIEVEYIN